MVEHEEETVTLKLLDCDSITQAKEKILDVLYRNTPVSCRPQLTEVDLGMILVSISLCVFLFLIATSLSALYIVQHCFLTILLLLKFIFQIESDDVSLFFLFSFFFFCDLVTEFVGKGANGVILRDQDSTNAKDSGWIRINTIGHYKLDEMVRGHQEHKLYLYSFCLLLLVARYIVCCCHC